MQRLVVLQRCKAGVSGQSVARSVSSAAIAAILDDGPDWAGSSGTSKLPFTRLMECLALDIFSWYEAA